jgi:hypothetical protein
VRPIIHDATGPSVVPDDAIRALTIACPALDLGCTGIAGVPCSDTRNDWWRRERDGSLWNVHAVRVLRARSPGHAIAAAGTGSPLRVGGPLRPLVRAEHRVYIASGLERADEVKALAAALAEHGIGLSYDWTAHGSVQSEGPERIAEVARAEIEGVATADLVIVWLPGGRGTHAELGIVIGINRARAAFGDWSKRPVTPTPILVVGPREGADGRECAFYYAPNIHRIEGPYTIPSTPETEARDRRDQLAFIVRKAVALLGARS